MMRTSFQHLDTQAQHLTLVQVTLRAVLIYLAGFILLRAGEVQVEAKVSALRIALA
jgi:hypothetical protein